MNAKLKPRKQTRFKPSRTGSRAAKASSTVGRPDELKILNLTYKVIFSSQEEMIVSGAMGFCSVDAQLIVVAEDQANDAMQDTFLHEVMHALTSGGGSWLIHSNHYDLHTIYILNIRITTQPRLT